MLTTMALFMLFDIAASCQCAQNDDDDRHANHLADFSVLAARWMSARWPRENSEALRTTTTPRRHETIEIVGSDTLIVKACKAVELGGLS